jgi:hypothetical protein
MDVFKLAFETTVVGVLAFLWLGIAVDLVYPPFFAKTVPEVLGKNDAVLGAAILSLAYCIGSAIVPISGQLVNDEHWPVPEDAIRCLVLEDQSHLLGGIGQAELLKPYEPGDDFDVCHRAFFERFREKDPETNQRIVTRHTIWAGVRKTFERRGAEHKAQDAKTERENDRKLDNILTKFQLIETEILNQGAEKTDRLKLLHERIVVLRGAVFSGISLFLICLFGTIAPRNGNSFPWKRRIWGTLLAIILTLLSVYNGLQDLKHFQISDIPVLESLLGVITIFGGFLVYYGVKERPYLGKRIVLVAGFFAALSYGGWMWTETIYDQQVISSYAVMERGPSPAVSK